MIRHEEGVTWQVWVDTGGTFTDCLAIDPSGRRHRVKVLSSGALRARVERVISSRALRFSAAWVLPEGFCKGARLRWLERPDGGLTLVGEGESQGRITVAEPLPEGLLGGETFEISFGQEAPVLAARLITRTAADRPLPPMALRLATTRGTNALLERQGAPNVLFVTRGFGDLLRIGDQQRPDLFALDIRRPPPLTTEVIEVDERLAADGSILRPLDLQSLEAKARSLAKRGIRSAAIALLHSYLNPEHEQRLAARLRAIGFTHLAASAELAPSIKILPRAETAVVDAYLGPIIRSYLGRVEAETAGSQIHMMTSAGGLRQSRDYRAMESLLSGPAGGVVGAARCARLCGYEKIVAFDMGGTSTDVSRYDGDYEYVFEHRVGDARVAAPALAIETVAAGGGSICWLDHEQLKVGPKSAGAEPGPAGYGAGGPLTLTDVNLLLGRLDPGRFGIPVSREASARALDALVADPRREKGEELAREELLSGFLDIANERMADAVRRISVRRGYDPRDHALVAFGGAGGQHACAVAELLDIQCILMPEDAGLLSALGLGAAQVERFCHRQVLRTLAEVGPGLRACFEELSDQAIEAVAEEVVETAEIEVRRRILRLRLTGQETSLEIDFEPDQDPAQAYDRAYREIYGYPAPERDIEVESIKVVASSRPLADPPAPAVVSRAAVARRQARAFFQSAWHQVPVFHRDELLAGDSLAGPALVFESHASLVVQAGWVAHRHSSGALVLLASGSEAGG